jgi:hypothetical protein
MCARQSTRTAAQVSAATAQRTAQPGYRIQARAVGRPEPPQPARRMRRQWSKRVPRAPSAGASSCVSPFLPMDGDATPGRRQLGRLLRQLASVVRVWRAPLLVFTHRYRAFFAESAARSRLRRIDRHSAPSAPRHMPAVARTPHRANRSTWVGIGVADRATSRRHNHPSALGGYEVADVVVGEVIARFGHCDVLPQATDIGSFESSSLCGCST